MLGRPWQYDRHVVHDGGLNQYTLWVNGNKQTLLPLIESLLEANFTAVKNCMVNGKKIEREVKNNQVFFARVPRGLSVGSNDRVVDAGNGWMRAENDDIDWVPIEIERLLDEYKEIIEEDIADGLLLVRSISHCMDFIRKASFMNKSP